MATKITWQDVDCDTATEILYAARAKTGTTVLAGSTDMDGEFGEPQMYREWGTIDGSPLMREWTYFDRDTDRCRHMAPTAA